jgi:LPXTG-motif cell wall-anchored protein
MTQIEALNGLDGNQPFLAKTGVGSNGGTYWTPEKGWLSMSPAGDLRPATSTEILLARLQHPLVLGAAAVAAVGGLLLFRRRRRSSAPLAGAGRRRRTRA